MSIKTSTLRSIMALPASILSVCSAASAADSSISPYVLSSDSSLSPYVMLPAAIAEVNFNNAKQEANRQGFAVVVLGTDKFRSEFGIPKSIGEISNYYKGKRIIILESDGHDHHTMMELLARGDILVTVGATAVNKAMSAMEMLEDINATGELQKAHSEYDENQVLAYGEDSAGNEIQAIVSGFSYVPNSPSSFDTTEQNVQIALTEAINWAIQTATKPQSSLQKSYTYVGQRTLNVNCTSNMSIYGGPTNDPVGNLTNIMSTYRSGNTRAWGIQYTTEMTHRGRWANSRLLTSSDIDSRHNGYELQGTAPGNTSGVSTVTIGFGTSGPFGSASYSVGNVNVSNQSSFSTELAQWVHDIREWTSAGTSRQEFRPVAEILLDSTQTSIVNRIPVTWEGEWYIRAVNGTQRCRGSLAATQ